MEYISTRGAAPVVHFEDALLAGLASDGGLYVPKSWPQISQAELRDLRGTSYCDVALAIIKRFVGETIAESELERMINDAYASFAHPAIAPLKQLDANQWLMELFHGPTLAFKDVAMQLLARLMDRALERRGQRATIVGATSGDTGGAAIEAFKASKRCRVFILHPHGRVSDVQRRQMTTVDSNTVYNIALQGNFDDCQAILKALFNDAPFRDAQHLAGVNSINWARIVAQIVYYFTAGISLGAPDRSVSFTVPTGNFGDIFAGYVAKRMGLSIDRLVIATNINDILHRALETGRYEVQGVSPTTSPSMDIQVSSNFERLLFDASGRDPAAILTMMQGLQQSGAFTIPNPVLDRIRTDFSSGRTEEESVSETIRRTLAETGELLDPHSAVGYAVARQGTESASAMVTLATAHPAKFPDAVVAASGVRPELPSHLQGLMTREERFDVLANDVEAVKAYISARVG